MKKSDAENPEYLVLAARLEREIRGGHFKTGQLLPSEQESASRFKATQYAVRQCYLELARRDLVRRVKHQGTVVIFDPAKIKIKKIGMIVISDVPSFFIFQKGVEQVLLERQAELRVRYNYNHEPSNQTAIQDALDHEVQGLIVAPPASSSFEPYRRLVTEGFPVVLALASDPVVHSVFPNDHRAGLLVGEHFGAKGFRRPAIVTDDSEYARLRVFGFREGMAHHGIKISDDRMIRIYYADEKGNLLTDLGRVQAEALLKLQPRPDAVFAVNDAVAIGVYYWLLKLGLRVPEDIAIAGIDNLGARFHPFQLTTVDIGLERMGREAGQLILDQIEKPQSKAVHREIEPQLMVSGSTGV